MNDAATGLDDVVHRQGSSRQQGATKAILVDK